MLQDTKEPTNETFKPATKSLQSSTYPTIKDEWDGATSQRVATSKVDVGLNHLPLKNKKSTCERVLPSAQKIQKVPGLMTNEESKVGVVGESESSESESSLGATDKVEIEKELKALMDIAAAEAIKQDEMLEEEMVRDLEKDLNKDQAEDLQKIPNVEILQVSLFKLKNYRPLH